MNQNHLLKNGDEVEIHRLTTNNLDAILSLQQKVTATLTTESFLQPLTKEEYLYILTGTGFAIGAFSNGKLIAFRAMLIPELDEEHLGKDAGLPRNDWPSVIYSEISNVDPDFRGNGLQVVLGRLVMEEIDVNRFRYVGTTVAPFNIASLKDKFVLGLEIIALKVKYGDKLRYIMMKDNMSALEKRNSLAIRKVDMANVEEQQQLLQQGWIGVGIEQMADRWLVRFEKREVAEPVLKLKREARYLGTTT